MKVEELTIGDWYYDQELNKPRRWHQLQYAESWGNDTYMLLCKPIPLTEEILKANGFESISSYTYELSVRWEYSVQVSLYDDGCVISISKDLKHKGVNSCHICYQGHVHKLQRALRCCGLNELADNFKIK